ncbi:MAG TPA: haloacid dehalogenase [Elusimicrobia bacterium]|nr:haloacid dehalogenase [Elusimicrobiota bacterium]
MKKISLRDLELIVYDFDGVMTDNTALLAADGREFVRVNRSDGMAVGKLSEMGILQIILTSETNPVVDARARKLKLKVLSGIKDKQTALARYCAKNGISLGKVLYIGNDINDLRAMLSVGLPVCPSDAYAEIKAISVLVLKTAGGKGVVRELLYYLTERRKT